MVKKDTKILLGAAAIAALVLFTNPSGGSGGGGWGEDEKEKIKKVVEEAPDIISETDVIPYKESPFSPEIFTSKKEDNIQNPYESAETFRFNIRTDEETTLLMKKDIIDEFGSDALSTPFRLILPGNFGVKESVTGFASYKKIQNSMPSSFGAFSYNKINSSPTQSLTKKQRLLSQGGSRYKTGVYQNIGTRDIGGSLRTVSGGYS